MSACAPTIDNVSPSPTAIGPNQISTITVTLASAPSNGCTVDIGFSDPNVFVSPIPTQVSFAQGSTTGSVQVKAISNPTGETVTITATSSAGSKTGQLQINSNTGG